MTVDLIITTYNRPDALECVLKSIMHQTILPNQVIIADDGSGKETEELINRYQINFPTKLIHSWQEDIGFRAAESRNLALSKVVSQYVIIIDGDIILEEHFIADHLEFALPGYFLQGGRVLMTEVKSKEILKDLPERLKVNIFDSSLESRLEKRLTAFRSKFLGKIFARKLKDMSKIRSCNMSFFFADVKKINGFNNKLVGWGREDSEFAERLINSGIKGKLIKFIALGYHIYHREESKASLPKNDLILEDTIQNKRIYCEDGLLKFL